MPTLSTTEHGMMFHRASAEAVTWDDGTRKRLGRVGNFWRKAGEVRTFPRLGNADPDPFGAPLGYQLRINGLTANLHMPIW
jgi:hypothetical protein